MQLTKLFLPNQPVPKKTRQMITCFWIAVAILVWVFSPFPFLPRPAETWSSLQEAWTYDNLGAEITTSFFLNLEAIGCSIIVSLGLAYLNTIGLFRPIVAVFGRLRFLSLVGLSFFFTLMTYNGHQLKLSILTFSISVFFVTGMCDVIANIPKEQYDLAKTLRMGPWEELWEVVVLGQMDQAFIVLRQNAAMGFMFLTTVEGFDRSGGGIGALLLNQQKHFHMAEILAIQFLVLAVGLSQDFAISKFRTMFCPYADLKVGN